MILAGLLLLIAVVLCLAMPRVLIPLTMRVPPTAVLVAWLATLAAVPLFVGAAVVVVAVWPHHAPGETVLETTARCLAVVVHSLTPWLGEVVASLAVLIAAAAAIRIGVVGQRYRRSAARVRAYHHDVMSVVARTNAEPDPIMWLDYPVPLAYSVDGDPGFIVATEGLRSLSALEQDAVLAHERAHLHGRHHRLLRICTVLATALPRVPLFAAAAPAVATLVELAADEAGAAATSRSAMLTALRTVAERGGSAAARAASAALADRDITLRLANLDTLRPVPHRPPLYAVALSFTVLLPAVVVVVGLSVASGAACLLLT